MDGKSFLSLHPYNMRFRPTRRTALFHSRVTAVFNDLREEQPCATPTIHVQTLVH